MTTLGIPLFKYPAALLLIFLCALLIFLTLHFFFQHTTEDQDAKKLLKPKKTVQATRHHGNPVLSPDQESEWEKIGTFNPAAYVDDSGKVHLLYRAIGGDGISRIGYASSKDGMSFDERLPYAVFSMQGIDRAGRYDPVSYPSGGSWGGTEDPRIVNIGERMYMTFNAFDGWDFIRIGVTSISKKDFLAKRWNWSKPMLLSTAGQINKNWVLFPEKINGKFAIIHSITPHIQIDFVERLESLASGTVAINSKYGHKAPRKGWDTWVRGAGPPPIKTSKGWLLLYHATNKNEPHKYQLGAMLLDLHDPTKVLARSPASILIPEAWYEDDWKPGIVYACGAVIKDELLYIYYGGGDKHVCVAHTHLTEFLDWLVHYGKGSITS